MTTTPEPAPGPDARRLLLERINELRETADNPIYLGIIRRWAAARANVLQEELNDLVKLDTTR